MIRQKNLAPLRDGNFLLSGYSIEIPQKTGGSVRLQKETGAINGFD
jgi:hypothetical protein